MPTVTLNRKVVENIIGKKLSDEELKDSISYLGTDLESIDGDEINVEIFPNRPDLLSEQGLGRALSSYVGKSKGLKEYKIHKSNYKLTVDKSVKGIRPYTACAVVKNLHFDDEKIREIVQIQEKLHITYGRNRKKCAIGVYPLEKIKFPIVLKAEDPKKRTFLPLESPGNREMTGLQVLSQHPTGRDYGHLLEGLNKFPFFIDAQDQVLSMPPIINSHNVGKISEETKEVFVECSGFDQKTLDICLNMIVYALADMGGEIYEITLTNEVDHWTKKYPLFEPERMNIDRDYVNRILGVDLTEKEIKDYLEKMGYGYNQKKKEALIPCYRSDILHQVDLIEDIAIAYGYYNFKEELPRCPSVGKRNDIELFKTKIAHLLSGLGLYESNTYCLIGEQAQNQTFSDQKIVKLANSVAEGYDSLRKTILPSLLQVLKTNKLREYPQGFFEVGLTFIADEQQETKVREGRNLAFVYCDKNADYTYARKILDYLMNSLDIDYTVKMTDKSKAFMEGRYAEVFIKNKSIGFVGQINPEVLEYFNLEMPVSACEIDFLALIKAIE